MGSALPPKKIVTYKNIIINLRSTYPFDFNGDTQKRYSRPELRTPKSRGGNEKKTIDEFNDICDYFDVLFEKLKKKLYNKILLLNVDESQINFHDDEYFTIRLHH